MDILTESIGKTMHLNPGGHVQTPAFERQAAEDFVRRYGIAAG